MSSMHTAPSQTLQTPPRRQSRELSRCEQQIRDLVDTATRTAVAVLDLEGRILFWNEGARRIYGKISADAVGRHYSIVFTPEELTAQEPQRLMREAAANYEPACSSRWRLAADGTSIWADTEMRASRDAKGNIFGFVHVLRDMTEYKQSEERLRTANAQLEQYRNMVQNIDEFALYTLDSKGYITSWGPGAQKVIGYAAEQIVGKHYSIFSTQEDIESGRPSKELEEAEQTGRCITDTWRKWNHAELRFCSGVITAVRDDQGTLTGFIRVTRDMTKQKRLEEALQELNRSLTESEARFRLLVEGVTDYAIYMLDPEGRIVTWNMGAERSKGYRLEEVLGKNFSILFLPEAAEAGLPRQELTLAARDGRFETEGWRVRKDGSKFWAHVTLTAIHGPEGELRGFAKVTRDMTRQKEFEASLEKLAANLEVRVAERTEQLESTVGALRKKNEEVESFSRIVSRDLKEKEVLLREIHHRVKNNLQVVQSLLKMSVRRLPECEARAAVESTVERVHAMSMVHERLYQMPNLSALPLADYLKDIFSNAIQAYSLAPSQVQLKLDVEEILLPLERAVPFALLTNELLSNSFKHGFPGETRGTISVSIHRVDNIIRMVIEDDGIGLPVGFDASKSTSMGLKLAGSLAHQLGGRLEFSSDKGCRIEAEFTRM